MRENFYLLFINYELFNILKNFFLNLSRYIPKFNHDFQAKLILAIVKTAQTLQEIPYKK